MKRTLYGESKRAQHRKHQRSQEDTSLSSTLPFLRVVFFHHLFTERSLWNSNHYWTQHFGLHVSAKWSSIAQSEMQNCTKTWREKVCRKIPQDNSAMNLIDQYWHTKCKQIEAVNCCMIASQKSYVLNSQGFLFTFSRHADRLLRCFVLLFVFFACCRRTIIRRSGF